MPKVKISTIWRTITKDCSIKPDSHTFTFKNTGTVTVFINNQPLRPGQWIGDDSSHLVSDQLKDKNLEVIREQDYEIKFGTNTTTGYEASDYAAVNPGLRRTLFLIETIYTIEQ